MSDLERVLTVVGKMDEEKEALEKELAQAHERIGRLLRYIGELSDSIYGMSGDDFGPILMYRAERADLMPGDLNPIPGDKA